MKLRLMFEVTANTHSKSQSNAYKSLIIDVPDQIEFIGIMGPVRIQDTRVVGAEFITEGEVTE